MKMKDKLYFLRTSHDLTQYEIAQICGASYPAVSQWESGARSPKIAPIAKLCTHFGVDLAKFVDESNDYWGNDFPANITPLPPMNVIPLIGNIACGEPNLASEDGQETVTAPEYVHADFALRCKGDSMINARIYDGDIVYIRRQPDVENGEIAAVRINDEATLKRVYKRTGYILLQPENPAYEPLILTPEEMETVQIIGKAVAFTSTVR